MLDVFFKKLKHPDPQVRRNAAEELGRLEDERALGPLKEVFDGDPDPQVRAAAKAAGQRIWQAKQARARPRPPEQAGPDEDALAYQIVAEAATANRPEPSLGDMIATMSAGGLFGLEAATLSLLASQAMEITREVHLKEQMELDRQMRLAFTETTDKEADKHPAPDPKPDGESPTPPPAKSGIRRIK